MRITRTGSGSPASGPRKAAAKSDGGFASKVSGASAGAPAAGASAAPATGGVASLGAVDSIMALQGADAFGERRQRALRKGRRMLDALDRLQIAVLDQNSSSAHLGLLQRALDEAREQSGDDGLDDALSHIEVRTAVEIAKLERARRLI